MCEEIEEWLATASFRSTKHSHMEKLIVHGGAPLKGRINISGSKNSSLPILAATLLTNDTCTIRRVPDLSDTNYMVRILGELGAEVERASGVVVMPACTRR